MSEESLTPDRSRAPSAGMSEYDEWWRDRHRECGPDCCVSGETCEYDYLPRCRQCHEFVAVRFIGNTAVGWKHYDSGLICCGDPDEGDERVAEPGPSRIYGVSPDPV